MIIKKLFIGSLLLTFLCSATFSDETNGPTARLSGTTIVASSLDKSIHFYTHILGFRETKIRQLDAPASRAVYGIASDAKVLYVPLLPTEFTRDNPYLSSLNLIHIPDAKPSTKEIDSNRQPAISEIILAYRVTNLEEILRRVEAEKVPVVTPYEPSATGKSFTLTILDPDGVRVHLYEYPESK